MNPRQKIISVKVRTEFHLHRIPEEFCDLTNDHCERTNLIGDPSRQAEIEAMRQELLALKRRTGDPFAEAFAQRDKEVHPDRGAGCRAGFACWRRQSAAWSRSSTITRPLSINAKIVSLTSRPFPCLRPRISWPRRSDSAIILR